MILETGTHGMKHNKRGVFTLSDDKVAFNSSFSRRLLARLLDYIIGGAIGFTMFMIFNYTMVPEITSTNVLDSLNGYEIIPFHEFMHPYYDSMFMASYAMSIVGILFTTTIFPIFNRRFKGQSLGKLIMKITPVFEGKFSHSRFLLREMSITLPILASYIFGLMVGADAVWTYVQWNTYVSKIHATALPELHVESPTYAPDLYKYAKNPFDFINNFWPYIDQVGATTFQQGIGYAKVVFQIISLSMLVLISLSILFDPVKRSLSDRIGKTAIVDTRTIQKSIDFEKVAETGNADLEIERVTKNKAPIKLKK